MSDSTTTGTSALGNTILSGTYAPWSNPRCLLVVPSIPASLQMADGCRFAQSP